MTSCLGMAPPTVNIPATPSWCIIALLSVFLSCCWGWTHEKGPGLSLETVIGMHATCWAAAVPIACIRLRSQGVYSRCVRKELRFRCHRESTPGPTIVIFWMDIANSYKCRQASYRLPHPRDCLQLASVLSQSGLFASPSPPTPWYYMKYSSDVIQFHQ